MKIDAADISAWLTGPCDRQLELGSVFETWVDPMVLLNVDHRITTDTHEFMVRPDPTTAREGQGGRVYVTVEIVQITSTGSVLASRSQPGQPGSL